MDLAELLFQLGQVAAGYVLAVSLEWTVHNLFFHRLGKRKGSIFGFHYHDHHRAVRRAGGGDPAFEGSRLAWNGYGREFWGIVVAATLVSPVALVAPVFWVTAVLSGWHYHVVHTRSHQDPEWCRTHLRWHWDHHMGKNPDTNWGVTNQWLDRLLGTRQPWRSKEEREALDAPACPVAARQAS
jgi:hypothetical protein